MRWVFSGDVSDEREGTFQPSEIELAKSEAVTQETLGRSPISANLRGRDQDRCWWLEKSVPQDFTKVAQYEVLG
jgi:hypothetical protein